MISAWWKENGTQISQAFVNAWNIIKPVIVFLAKFIWESIKGLISGVITFFQGLIEFFTGVFTGDWKMAWEGVKKIFIGAFQAIWNFTNLTFIGGLKKGILTLVKDMGKNLKGFMDDAIKWFQNIWSNLGRIITSMKTGFKGMIDNFSNWWVSLCLNIALRWVGFANSVKSTAQSAWSGIKSAFGDAVNWFVRSVITPIVNRFNDIKNAFRSGITNGLKAVLNSVRGPINAMISGLNAVKNKIPLANMLPNIPTIHPFAQGGIVSSPVLGLIGEGRQDEAVAPLDKLQGFINNAVLNAMGTNTGGTGDIILNIDGRTFARIVKPFLDKEKNRLGRRKN